jgi:hypothetical protein
VLPSTRRRCLVRTARRAAPPPPVWHGKGCTTWAIGLATSAGSDGAGVVAGLILAAEQLPPRGRARRQGTLTQLKHRPQPWRRSTAGPPAGHNGPAGPPDRLAHHEGRALGRARPRGSCGACWISCSGDSAVAPVERVVGAGRALQEEGSPGEEGDGALTPTDVGADGVLD